MPARWRGPDEAPYPPPEPRTADSTPPARSVRKKGKNRVHLDAEGATVVADLYTTEHGGFQVMLDPEGDEFCLVK